MNEEKGWTVTTTNDESCNESLPITVTRNSLRKFILEILKEKGLLQENNQ